MLRLACSFLPLGLQRGRRLAPRPRATRETTDTNTKKRGENKDARSDTYALLATREDGVCGREGARGPRLDCVDRALLACKPPNIPAGVWLQVIE